jgi:UDP-N-acetylmuramoylalanine--D-glutamate ligase
MTELDLKLQSLLLKNNLRTKWFMDIVKFKIIIGLGKTGLSCAKYLTDHHINFIMMDTRENPPGLEEFKKLYPEIPVYTGKFNPELIQQSQEIIISPGISPESLPPEKTIGDIELFARAAKAPIVAITGTNAKGTVTTLTSKMIEQAGLTAAVGGNIGTPALDLLTQKIPDFYVLEISSFQLETTHQLSAKAAVILNLTPDHLDRHKTMETYQKIKQRIYRHTETAVFNRDDPYTFPVYATPHQISFGLDKPKEHQFGLYKQHLAYGENLLLPVSDLKIQGKHNWSNALAALALGQAIGLPMEKMCEALHYFPGLSHRCEWIGTQDNIQWINDSKGTNIGASLAALEGLGENSKGKIILIAGGIGKDADFTLLQEAVRRYTRQLILIGQDAPLMAKALSLYTEVKFAPTLQEAVKMAQLSALPGDTVLLSPACASFDMFQDFEDRGNQFKLLVRDLLHL